MSKIDTSELLKIGQSLSVEAEEIADKRAANRDLLRKLDAADMLSDAESEELANIYPVRERRSAEEIAEQEAEEGEE